MENVLVVKNLVKTFKLSAKQQKLMCVITSTGFFFITLIKVLVFSFLSLSETLVRLKVEFNRSGIASVNHVPNLNITNL